MSSPLERSLKLPGNRPANRRLYRLGDAQVDTLRPEITVGGRTIELRQKTFQVLLYLLEHHDRVVSKEELLEQVWGGSAVTEGTLSQCLVDLRRALGDDARNPRYLKTYPKSGFRLICEVEEVASLATAAVEVTSMEIEVVEEVQDPVPTSPARPALIGGAKLSRRWLAAAVVVAGLIGATLALRPRQPELTLPSVDGKTAVLVLLFDNASSDRELAWLREGLADMVIADLSSAGRLSVLSHQQLQLLLERSGVGSGTVPLTRALELARQSRAGAVISGSYMRLGPTIRITVEMHDVDSGRLLAAESATAERPQRIFSEVDGLAGRLLARLGVAPNVTPAPGLAVAMTGNLEAYRLYSIALERLAAWRDPEAIELLEQAIKLDPDFAMAHARIGNSYAGRFHDPQRGRPYLARAFALSHRLNDRDRVLIAAWYAAANSDPQAAIRAYQKLIDAYPDEVEAYLRLSALLREEGRVAEGLEVARQAAERDPQGADLQNELAGLYSDAGRYEEAIAAARRYVELSGEANAYDTLALQLHAVGRYDEAVAAYRQALERKPDFGLANLHLGSTYFAQGRYRLAMEEYRIFTARTDSDYGHQRGHACLATVHLARRELSEAAREASQGFVATELAVALARGDVTAASALAARLPGWGNRLANREDLHPHAMLALRRGDTEQGLSLLREMLKHKPLIWTIQTFEDELGNAFLSLKRYDEAITEYQRVVAMNPRFPLARYRLGLALEAKGDGARARDEYRKFLEDWKDADRDVPELADARRRLGR